MNQLQVTARMNIIIKAINCEDEMKPRHGTTFPDLAFTADQTLIFIGDATKRCALVKPRNHVNNLL